MALEIYWTKRAARKFDKIIEYIDTEWEENAAKAFAMRVYDFLDIYQNFRK